MIETKTPEPTFILHDHDDIEAVARAAGMIGNSPAIRNILSDMIKIAPSDVPVLVVGESGTGKDLVAKAIHQLSHRKQRPLIIVNSGAIAEGILESELFGHEKGAFTGAVGERKGYFESANGGTIFLDEIGDMPLATQVKLLRVLETGEFLRVGGSTTKKSDVRVIAATNRNLETMVRRGDFRKDLYYRLKAITIELPPLRARQDDIPLLVEKFIDDFTQNKHASVRGLSRDAMEMLVRYRWPGNVRELRNFVESLITLKRGDLVTADDVARHLEKFRDVDRLDEEAVHLPMRMNVTPEQAERELLYRTLLALKQDITDIKHFLAAKFGRSASTSSDSLSTGPVEKLQPGKIVEPEVFNVEEPPVDPSDMTVNDVERDLIIRALKKYDGKRSLAAKSLGLSERTLYRKIKQYQLDL